MSFIDIALELRFMVLLTAAIWICLQGPRAEEDEELCSLVNIHLNRPLAGSS